MIYHVLPGDAQVEEFKKTAIDGELIVCREALITGPIDAANLDEFWAQRAAFILSEGEDEITYHEKVADPLNSLTELGPDDEVCLWFEYELFCSVNMWFCLSLLSGTGATVYRVEPIGLNEETRWDGFGKFTSDDMAAAYELRSEFTADEVMLGADLWEAYRTQNHSRLKELSATMSDRFPYLGEVAAAAIEQDIRPLEIVREITENGETDFGKVFAEFRKRAGVYGYGDTQVQGLIGKLRA